MTPFPALTSREIVAARPARGAVPSPFALVEPERTATGTIEDILTLFLVNSECPFKCLMCDLWQYTLDGPTPPGSVMLQIRDFLVNHSGMRHVKLYNAGNFFDRRAIAVDERPAIARLLRGFQTVIVENHPSLCSDDCLRFAELLDGQFEVAMGLETIHPQILPLLNKEMTGDDFANASQFLVSNGIAVRTFVLLCPPGLDEDGGIEWAVRSCEFAFEQGASCCTIIPTRGGNGAMERLRELSIYQPPSLAAVEAAFDKALKLNAGRVFVDLWNLEQFCGAADDFARRRERLHQANLQQTLDIAAD